MVSPPKPWERNGSVAAATPSSSSPASIPLATQSAAAASNPAPPTTTAASSAPSSSTSSSSPTVPARPASFSNLSTTTTALTNPSTATTAASAYTSPYNRLGGYSPYQSSMYGGAGMGMGYGGYSSYGMGGMYPGSYGGMGMGMGMNGMGMGGMYGQPPFGPGNPSLTQTLESTTQHTFALLQSIVQTFSGLAQMLESTFMATHSSFFALAGVVDQFAQLRNALGGVLGLFGLVRWMKDTLTGRTSSPLTGEFRDFAAGRPVAPPAPQQPRASRKPLVIFLLAIFGIPYAMHRLIKILSSRQPAHLLPPQQQLGPLDPTQLTFARAKHAFGASSPAELALAENEIVAVMGKLDPVSGAECDPRLEVESEWWKGRTREGREGWFPRAFVEVLERRGVKGEGVQGGAAQPQVQGEAKKVD